MNITTKNNEINKKEMKMGKLSLILIAFVIFSGYASAFGIGSAYHKDNPLKLGVGETKEIVFNLQNMPGPADISARPSISKGSEVLALINSGDILVPVGGSIDVKAKVSIPVSAKIGDIYPIEITFTTLAKSESGTFSFGSSVGKGFNIIVVPAAEEALPEEKASTTWITYLIVGILLLILIILAVRYIKGKK